MYLVNKVTLKNNEKLIGSIAIYSNENFRLNYIITLASEIP